MITSARYFGRGPSFCLISEVDVRDVAQVITGVMLSGPGCLARSVVNEIFSDDQ